MIAYPENMGYICHGSNWFDLVALKSAAFDCLVASFQLLIVDLLVRAAVVAETLAFGSSPGGGGGLPTY